MTHIKRRRRINIPSLKGADSGQKSRNPLMKLSAGELGIVLGYV